jgi:phage terminase large subunit-like protein
VKEMLEIVEDDRFYFDPVAAERPIRFGETFARHFEGELWAGTLLKYTAWQRSIIRSLYGWKRKDNGRRRFTELFLLSAKGAGKTPFLSSIGLYEMFAGGERAAHVVSMAKNYKQAYLTMEWAKEAIKQDKQLGARADVTQHVIRVGTSKWTTLSGTFAGNAGFRPSCILADEAWEWPNSRLYDSVTANKFKRTQPLLLVATNAGEGRTSFCWQLYEQAKAVLEGRSQRTDLLPVIFEAGEELAWDSEEAARAACPSIPEVVSFDSLTPKIVAARESPGAKAEYERLHLSRWVTGGVNKWIDLRKWDACTSTLDPEKLKTATVYVGVDLSLGDDLCAVLYVWVTPERFYVRSHFYLPRVTALDYEKTHAIPYKVWADDGHLTLTTGPTIGTAERQKIADDIIAVSKAHKVKGVYYDRAKAEDAIAQLEGAGMTCVPIPQGYTLWPGCELLQSKLTEKSIVIEPNPVLRLCAENVEVKYDERGNYWPVKPNAKGRYAGTRSAKIDGITALVTALTEARKHSFPAAQKQWRGQVMVIET